ncbi:TPA: YSIRK-type signal peptide-containing protein, partial [Streptococcus pyogenes]|nr:YSIRK-type signal peptide-containing protein [Streptococcus pyogenes]
MARENTNKHYSLRKLKKGTASVAVALSVLGAGLVVNTNEVSAAVTRSMVNDPQKAKQIIDGYELANHSLTAKNEVLEAAKSELESKNAELTSEKEKYEAENGSLKQQLFTQREALEKKLATKEQESKETIDALNKILDETVKDKIAKEQESKETIGTLKQELAKKEEQNK